MQNKLFKYFPFLFLIGIWFTFAYPYFLQAKVPYPSTYQVNHFQPWSLDQKYWGPVKNGAMPDVVDQIYPWRHFSIQEWKEGRVPWWNPNSFSGNPQIAGVQSAAFSPFTILFFVLPFIDAWSLLILLQPLIAGTCMYFLLRFYKISSAGSLLGSISWMFCGFIVTWMAYGTLSMAIAVLPLVLFCLHMYGNSGKFRWGVAGSFVIAFSFFSGHFQTSLYLFLVSIAYCLFLFFSVSRRRASFVVLFVFIGLIFASIQLLPAIQFYNLSPRSAIFLFSGGIPLHYLVTLFAPDFFGNPVTRNDWFGYYAEWSSFVGIIPLFFALLAIGRKQKKEILFFQTLLLIALLLSIASPVQKIIGLLHIPVLSTSNPSRLIVIVSFSVAILSGFGFDQFRQWIKNASFKKIIPYCIVITIILFIIWASVLFSNFLNVEHAQIAKKNLLLPTAIYSVLVASIFAAFLLRRKEKLLRFVFFAILLLPSFDSVRFAVKWMPFDPKQFVFPSAPVITAMQARIGQGRVFGNIGAQVGTYYNLPLIEGYDPLYIDRYGEFIRTSATGKYLSSERSVVKIDRTGKFTKRVLDLLAVELIYHPNPDTNQSWAFPVWKDPRYKEVYRNRLFSLYKNTTAVSRPALYYSYEVIPESKKLLTRFYEQEFDYKKKLLLEEDPGIASSSISGNGSIKLVSETPTDIQYLVTTDKEGLLFLSDNYYPGWKVSVNGRREKLLRADYTFRAVVVPKGTSRVQFFYKNLF